MRRLQGYFFLFLSFFFPEYSAIQSNHQPCYQRAHVGALFIISITIPYRSFVGRKRDPLIRMTSLLVCIAKIMGIYSFIFDKILRGGYKDFYGRNKKARRVKRKIFFPSDLVKICVRDDGGNKSAEVVGLS